MTHAQALRYQRRAALRARKAEQIREAALAAIFIFLLLVAMGITGTMDYEDEMREIAYWESQGIHIVRDW